jgi:hypothetical protein
MRLFRQGPPRHAQVEPAIAPGVPAALQRRVRTGTLSGLPAARRSPAHWSAHQHLHVPNLWLIRIHRRLTSATLVAGAGEGRHQASSLACPFRSFWADGHRDD